MRSRNVSIIAILALILFAGALSPLKGQNETIITIAIPSWMGDAFRDDLFDDFETQHPGVKVVTVPIGNDAYYASAAYQLDEHLDAAQKYVSTADVVYTSSYNLSVESTRAGYFLDLAPLINSDPNFNVDDFFPNIWKSFQWDGGIWGIPVSASVQMLVYDKKAFDAAGLTYPSENWTFDDLANAARKLTTHNDKGDVDLPGFQGYSPGLFYYAMTGHGFYDSSVIPSPPKFDDPGLPAFYEAWNALQKEVTAKGNFDYNSVPLTLNSPYQLTNPNPDDTHEWAASLLPGGIAGLDVQGFAVSGGTLNPELAYALANYVSTNPTVINRFFGNTPVRRSMVGVKADDDQFFMSPVPADVQTLIDDAVQKGVPTSELRYSDYIDVAMNPPDADQGASPDVASVIQEAQANALKALDTAAARRSSATVYVSTPVPTPSFGADQIVLNFGLNAFSSDIPNRDQWDQLVKDFLAENPAIGNVDIQTQFYQQEDLDKLDCYYQPYNMVADMKLEDYLNLDPFMDADPNFDRGDFMGSVLNQVQRDNHTWAYPIVIQPSVMWYNTDLFTKAGVPSPEQGWSINDFRDALQSLRGVMDDAKDPVFAPESFGNTYLLMLIAAYGGIPYDYRTSPPTMNFTDPTNVDAIRQVLDLAKDGSIGYQKLYGNNSYFGGNDAPIIDDTLSSNSWRLQNRVGSTDSAGPVDPHHLTNFPRGDHIVPVAYGEGAAYIQSHAQNPEACYNWIAKIANRPDLFAGMPVRLSQLSDPTITASQGEDLTALYQGFSQTFQDPNAIAFPGQFGSGGGFNSYVEPMWLNKAFDNYVLEDGDLESDLAEAQTMAMAYRDCASVIPDPDPDKLTTPEESMAFYRQYTDCAVKIDPSMKETFSYYYTDTTQ
jgi:ABC-type glycerol-3-phosphate transport system substrate-binding protein